MLWLVVAALAGFWGGYRYHGKQRHDAGVQGLYRRRRVEAMLEGQD